jgi:hypothetical protein
LEDRPVVRDGEIESFDFGKRSPQDGESGASIFASAKRYDNSQQNSGS